MDLTHEFAVPASIDETWNALNDIESVAGCFPGATVTSVEGDTFKGSCKVKLGPIALVYNGSGSFVEKDEATHTMRVEATGKDKRGNGTAGANVTATMVEQDGGTLVTVVTDLAITGKPAQFGRGVIQDVSDKLLGQFVECLQSKVGAPQSAADTDPASSEAEGEDAAGGGAHRATGDASAGAATSSSSGENDNALDLGATVLPVLVKSYGKQVAAALGVVGVLLVLRSLLRGRKR